MSNFTNKYLNRCERYDYFINKIIYIGVEVRFGLQRIGLNDGI